MLRHSSQYAAAILLLLASLACRSTAQRAGDTYKKQRDYKSLVVIYEHLEHGMTREQVEALIGQPDVTPEDGQAYYPSDRTEPRDVAPGMREEVSVGLMVDYRNIETKKPTPTVQRFRLGPVGGDF